MQEQNVCKKLENAHLCHFCASDRSCFLQQEREKYIVGDGAAVRNIYYIFCNGCGARGPRRTTEEDAVREWNGGMLREAAAAVLAYMEEINSYLSPDERIAVHFKWREGTGPDLEKAVSLFRCLRELV